MKHNLKHLQSLVAVAVCVIMAMAFTSCSDDDDEPELSKSNAKGVSISYHTYGLDIDNVYLWINEYGIYTKDPEYSEINLKYYTYRGINYYPLTMNVVYELLSEVYGTDINAETDFSKFNPPVTECINYIRNNKSKYKYIAYYSRDFVLFNRTSNENFY